jgi:hypothetical protein
MKCLHVILARKPFWLRYSHFVLTAFRHRSDARDDR